MGKKEDSRSGRRFAKPGAFLLIVFLLFFVSKFEVQFTPMTGLTALPDAVKDGVLVSSMNGIAQMVNDLVSEDAELPPQPVDFKTMNMSNSEILMQPQISHEAGCTSDFMNNIRVNVTISNDLSAATRGVINISVYDGVTGDLLSSKLFPLNLEPHTPFSVSAAFSVLTPEADPVFDIKATFPTAEELGLAQIPTHMTLLEYILIKAGLHLTT